MCFLAAVGRQNAFCQGDIPVGTWRPHGNYTQPLQLSGAGKTVFTLGENSLFFISEASPTPTPLGYQDGLYGQAKSRMAYHSPTRTLVLAYEDGTLEMIDETRVRRINDLKNNALIIGKRIKQIVLFGDTAWLAAEFGIAALSLSDGFVKRSFLNIGANGSALSITGLAITDRGIYALSEQGLQFGDHHANLNDFNHWRRLTLSASTGFKEIHALGETLYLVGNDQQIYQWKNEKLEWVAGTFGVANAKTMDGRLIFQMENQFYEINGLGNIQPIPFSTTLPWIDFHLADESMYLAVPGIGLWRLPDSVSLTPNGIGSISPTFYSAGDNLYAFDRWERVLDHFNQGKWQTYQTPEGITSVAQAQGVLYLGAQNGLFRFVGNEFEEVNLSPLPPNSGVQAMASDSQGNLYLVAEGATPQLGLLEGSGAFRILGISGMGRVEKIVVDGSGNSWLMELPRGGARNLRVVNPSSGLDRTIGNTLGQGGLPSNTVQDIFLDSEQNLWIATTQGLGYFFNTRLLTQTASLNALLPIFQNRQVLANTSVTQLIVAPDRSVWAGTASQGLWQFSEGFEGVLHHFTPANSPLPSQSVHSLSLNKRTGELFISTDRGALSFRASSVQASEKLENLKIYPNPVHAGFSGVLSIEGLTDFAALKISHSSGRVVYTTRVAGGKITWDMRTDEGKRLSPGVYIVYVLDEGGNERAAGKFLIM
ncbi:hypothetical protein ADIS_4469 [Lunatimonas lonarensis]|uniref:PorZ N-terminal beta-propeller domain-containing protein n=1 Tax=Lunatimonas lonarensis TaxID=1232681 RepID=R7ZLK9_9BACT|nr:hypothetical protein ADIS_4469 [Lunatimonas lonarensis]